MAWLQEAKTLLAALAERCSGYTILAKFSGKDANLVVYAVICGVIKLPLQLRKTLTWGQGMEMAKYREFTI